ncbi:hypothetical protein SLS53_006962 [Cytospora paraplurivora]|uniref:Potassium channel domain-containing protein n=1 Tax=Cytospora paraplurivora TaxID=2898453 RepID=A0AAN9U9Z3_9PEZI
MMADSGDRVGEHIEAFDSQDPQKPRETGEGEQGQHQLQQQHEERHRDQDQQERLHEEQSPGGDPIQNDEAHLDPSRWWFASSAIPMIAGTLGPVASAFSICALVRPWRQQFPPGSDIDKAPFIADPIWLTVINAIQLGVAVVANLVLLLNMARKIRFSVAQPVTIAAWYFSSICLLALSATAGGPLQEEPKSLYIWSQAFYYGIYAACLYFFCSSLMIITFYGAIKGHYSKDFQLTTSQRTLMLQTIMFLIYLLVGALVFSSIEDWNYLDAVYWADVTLFTVGFGDYGATTPLGRALLFPFALVGVISLGLVVGSIRSLALDRGQRQLSARIEEKERKRTLKRKIRSGKDDILIPVNTDETDHDFLDRDGPVLTEYQRRKEEFELMRRIQIRAEHRRRWMAMGISTTAWLVLWLVGAAIFQQCEVKYQGWTYFDGFYFAFVSLTTIGYGDVTPISPAGKSFFVFWSLLALPTMTVLISNAGDTVVKFVREATDVLGTITILPDERGVKKGFKEILKSLSMGQVFADDSDIEESAPGGLGFAEKHNAERGMEDEEKGFTGKLRRTHDRSIGRIKSKIRGENSKYAGNQQADEEVTSAQEGLAQTDGGGSGKATTKSDPPTHETTPSAPTIRQRTSSATKSNNRLSFKDPPEQPYSLKKHHGFRLRRSSTMSSRDTKPARGRYQNDNEWQRKRKREVSIARSPSEMPHSVPTEIHEYHFILIDEISRVTEHLRSQPPRKYSFDEWAWYLKLIGEDERSARRHQKALPQQKKKSDSVEDGQDATTEEDPEKLQWSWVGTRSPLMGSQEEAEWILEKLELKLKSELQRVRDEARKGESHNDSNDGLGGT